MSTILTNTQIKQMNFAKTLNKDFMTFEIMQSVFTTYCLHDKQMPQNCKQFGSICIQTLCVSEYVYKFFLAWPKASELDFDNHTYS